MWGVVCALLVCAPSVWIGLVLICTVYSLTKNIKVVLFSFLLLALGWILNINVTWPQIVFEICLVIWSVFIVRSALQEPEGDGRSVLYSFIILWELNFSMINGLQNAVIILSVLYVSYFTSAAIFAAVFQGLSDLES